MNKNGITTALAVMAFAGVIIHGVAPRNTADLSLDSGASAQSATEPTPAAEASTSTATTAAPMPASAPASDSLLREVKVYPSF